MRERNGSKKLPVVPSQYGKTPPDRYIFQWEGKALCQDILNVLLRFLLRGLVFKRTDGKPVHLTSHMLRHAFATEEADQRVPFDVIARILPQRDTTVTKYYSRRTAAQVIEAAEMMFIERSMWERRSFAIRRRSGGCDATRRQKSERARFGVCVCAIGLRALLRPCSCVFRFPQRQLCDTSSNASAMAFAQYYFRAASRPRPMGLECGLSDAGAHSTEECAGRLPELQ
ncbi:MAG: site-specific integrase [Acidobacteriaceae bacterium]|nr:site-specific integrase [Acidobacteriaceae bacterium]